MKKLSNLASCLLLSVFFISVNAYGSNPVNDDNVDESQKNKMISVPYMCAGAFLRNENGHFTKYVKKLPLDSSDKILFTIDKVLSAVNAHDSETLNNLENNLCDGFLIEIDKYGFITIIPKDIEPIIYILPIADIPKSIDEQLKTDYFVWSKL
ncbi:MAG: hypothetical protein ACRYGR_00800 [Janthinobacterium lividum]